MNNHIVHFFVLWLRVHARTALSIIAVAVPALVADAIAGPFHLLAWRSLLAPQPTSHRRRSQAKRMAQTRSLRARFQFKRHSPQKEELRLHSTLARTHFSRLPLFKRLVRSREPGL